MRLELIEIITSSYSDSVRLAALKSCVCSMDAPINLHCNRLGRETANAAMLDCIKQTSANFGKQSVYDLFSPTDVYSGQARLWVDDGMGQLARTGRSSLYMLAWDGFKRLPVKSESIMIGGWIVSAWTLKPGLVSAQAGRNSQAFPRSLRRVHKGLLPSPQPALHPTQAPPH